MIVINEEQNFSNSVINVVNPMQKFSNSVFIMVNWMQKFSNSVIIVVNSMQKFSIKFSNYCGKLRRLQTNRDDVTFLISEQTLQKANNSILERPP